MNTSRRIQVVLALAVIAMLTVPWAVLADPIVNNIDATVDPTLEIQTITTDSSTVVGFYVLPSNNDPSEDAPGCNATGSDPVFVTLSVPTGVTASPKSFTVVGCGNVYNVTFSSSTAGSYDIGIASVTGGKDGSKWNTAPAAFTLKVNTPASSDSTPPVITPNVVGTLGINGWYTSDVLVSWTVSDPESSITSSSGCDSTTINTDTTGTTFTCTATSAGGTSTQSVTIKRDATAPTGVTVSADRAPDSNGWYNKSFTATWKGTDATSGIDSCTVTPYSGPDTGSGSLSGTCTDKAGNTSAAVDFAFMYDATAPALNITGAASGAYNVCAIPTRPTFAPTDNLSGIDTAHTGDSWTTPGTASGIGTYTYKASAADMAGNTASETRTYNVTYAGAVSSFLQPINLDGRSNFKLGSTIPVKFTVSCSGMPVAGVVANLYVKFGDAAPDPGELEAISTAAATTGSLFRYDTSGAQYIFNLSTKSNYTNPNGGGTVVFVQGTWTLRAHLDDGSDIIDTIQVKK